MLWRVFCSALFFIHVAVPVDGLLYIQKNEARSYESLDGLWTFVLDQEFAEDAVGFKNKWEALDLSKFENATTMPVPSAYNDIIPTFEVRNHIGWVWYQTTFIPQTRDSALQHVIKFESVNYRARIYVNGAEVGSNEGGHLPFQFVINPRFGKVNTLTVAVDNTLTNVTIPQGEINHSSYFGYDYVDAVPSMDFFNYAGILRPVSLLKLSPINIKDIILVAEADGSITYTVKLNVEKLPDKYTVQVSVIDNNENGPKVLYKASGLVGTGVVPDVKPWWPRHYGNQTLYQLEVSILDKNKNIVDIYRDPIGFRTIKIVDNKLNINGKPFYCVGFGMHEDFYVIGRGFNLPLASKEFNLLEWSEANCFRTSHYPYHELRMYEADRRGIVVIDEVSAVGLKQFDNIALHKNFLTRLFLRDNRHPAVIMWSIANEPKSDLPSARPYFSELLDHLRKLDPSRPLTVVTFILPNSEKISDLLDVLCFNRYTGWYQAWGHSDAAATSIKEVIQEYHDKFHKPIIVTEYGAGSLDELSRLPAEPYTWNYHIEMLKSNFEAFDSARAQNWTTGEFVWNFADFDTIATSGRVVGNRKGVFTRSREPKPAAYTIRERYTLLSRP